MCCTWCFLNLCCSSFADELAKELNEATARDDGNDGEDGDEPSGGGGCDEVDWDVEDLVLAGYCSLSSAA